MSSLLRWSVLTVACLLCPQQGRAQPTACGGDYACVTDDPVGEATWAGTHGPRLRGHGRADPAARTNQHRCVDAPVDVVAASEGERQLVCSAASQALQLLGHCGIAPRRPLQIEILSEVRHPFNGAILGLLDIKRDIVVVTREANVPSLIKDTPFARLSLRDFYRSLIVHETVHGVMQQNLQRRLASHAEAEYPAYALQIESLPPDARDRFFQPLEQVATKADDVLFNDFTLLGDPFVFAALAYRHFSTLGNGCRHLQALLLGEARFVVTLPDGW